MKAAAYTNIVSQTILDLVCRPWPAQRQTQSHDPDDNEDAIDCRYWPWTPAHVPIQFGSNANGVLLPMPLLFPLLLLLLLTWPRFPIWHEVSATTTSNGEHEPPEVTSPCPAQQLQLQRKQEWKSRSRGTRQGKKQHSLSTPFSSCSLRGGPKYRTSWGRFELDNERCISTSSSEKATKPPLWVHMARCSVHMKGTLPWRSW